MPGVKLVRVVVAAAAAVAALGATGCGNGTSSPDAGADSTTARDSGSRADGADIARLVANLSVTEKGVAAAEALAKVGAADPRVIPALVAALASHDPRVAAAASDALVACGPPALDAVMGALGKMEDAPRSVATETAMRFGDAGLRRVRRTQRPKPCPRRRRSSAPVTPVFARSLATCRTRRCATRRYGSFPGRRPSRC
jgi:hypothetical protein